MRGSVTDEDEDVQVELLAIFGNNSCFGNEMVVNTRMLGNVIKKYILLQIFTKDIMLIVQLGEEEEALRSIESSRNDAPNIIPRGEYYPNIILRGEPNIIQ